MREGEGKFQNQTDIRTEEMLPFPERLPFRLFSALFLDNSLHVYILYLYARSSKSVNPFRKQNEKLI